METTHEIIDLVTGNVIGAFSTELEAIAALRAVIDESGSSHLADLALMRVVDEDQSMVAMEGDLVGLVERLRLTPPSAD